MKNLNTEIFLIVFYGNFLILRNEPLFSMCKFCTPCFQWLNISFRLESFALTYLLLIRSGEGRVCVWDELKNYTPVFLLRKFFPMSIVNYLKWSFFAKIDKGIQPLFWIHFWLASFLLKKKMDSHLCHICLKIIMSQKFFPENVSRYPPLFSSVGVLNKGVVLIVWSGITLCILITINIRILISEQWK